MAATDNYHCSGYCLECGRKLVWAGTHWGRHSPGRHLFWRQHLLAVIARQLRKLEETKERSARWQLA